MEDSQSFNKKKTDRKDQIIHCWLNLIMRAAEVCITVLTLVLPLHPNLSLTFVVRRNSDGLKLIWLE